MCGTKPQRFTKPIPQRSLMAMLLLRWLELLFHLCCLRSTVAMHRQLARRVAMTRRQVHSVAITRFQRILCTAAMHLYLTRS